MLRGASRQMRRSVQGETSSGHKVIEVDQAADQPRQQIWMRYPGDDKLYLVGGAIAILKNMSSSMGRMTSHILWKIKFMFQTTNQILYPAVNFYIDPDRGWKSIVSMKNWGFSGSMFIYQRVICVA